MFKKINAFVSEYACSLTHLICISIGVWSGVYCCYLINLQQRVYPVIIIMPDGLRVEVFESKRKQLDFLFTHRDLKTKEFEEVVK